MQAFAQTTLFSSGGLVGVEPMPLVTYSLTLDPAQGTLFAGTLIDAGGKKSATVAAATGVLAFDVTTDATEQTGATVYTSGSFLASRIQAANSALAFDSAAIADLRAKNIYLERSIPISVPAPVAPVTAAATDAAAPAEPEKQTEPRQPERYVASAATATAAAKRH